MALSGPEAVVGSCSPQLYFFPNTKVMFLFSSGGGYDNHTLSIKYSIDGGTEQTRNDVEPINVTFNGKTTKLYDGLLRITQSLSFGKHTIRHSERDVTFGSSWSSYTTNTFYIVDTSNISAGTLLTPKNFLIYCGFIIHGLSIANQTNTFVSPLRGTWGVNIYPYIENGGSYFPSVGNIIYGGQSYSSGNSPNYKNFVDAIRQASNAVLGTSLGSINNATITASFLNSLRTAAYNKYMALYNVLNSLY